MPLASSSSPSKKRGKKATLSTVPGNRPAQHPSNSQCVQPQRSVRYEKLRNHCAHIAARRAHTGAIDIAMRTFILFITAGAVEAFAPQPRQLLSPATTQMTTAATAVPVATSRAVHKSNCRGARHRRDVSTAPDSLVYLHTGRARRQHWRPHERRPKT